VKWICGAKETKGLRDSGGDEPGGDHTGRNQGSVIWIWNACGRELSEYPPISQLSILSTRLLTFLSTSKVLIEKKGKEEKAWNYIFNVRHGIISSKATLSAVSRPCPSCSRDWFLDEVYPIFLAHELL
jgi:hypothetical protein